MRLALGFFKVELDAAGDYVLLMGDVVAEYLLQV